MALHPEVEKHLNEIRAASERYGISKLEVFGSAMTEKFDLERSDVDFIVHYPPGYVYGSFGKRLFDLEEEITKILGRTAQLVMTSALKKESFRQSADMTRMTIYESSPLDSGTPRHQNPLPVQRR